jgi:hypothetical protein
MITNRCTYINLLKIQIRSTIGIEATFEKVSVGNWSYRLSYNLSQTTEGRYGYAVIYPDNSRNFALRSTNRRVFISV